MNSLIINKPYFTKIFVMFFLKKRQQAKILQWLMLSGSNLHGFVVLSLRVSVFFLFFFCN